MVREQQKAEGIKPIDGSAQLGPQLKHPFFFPSLQHFPFQWLRSVYDQRFKFNHTCDHHNNSISTVFYIIHVWEWQKWSRQLIHSDGSDKEAVIISTDWHFLSQSLPTGSSGNGSVLHKVVFEDKTSSS